MMKQQTTKWDSTNYRSNLIFTLLNLCLVTHVNTIKKLPDILVLHMAFLHTYKTKPNNHKISHLLYMKQSKQTTSKPSIQK